MSKQITYVLLTLAMAFASPAIAQPPLSSTVLGRDMTVQKAGRRPYLGGQVLTPDSSVSKPDEAGRSAHTHFKVFIPRQPAEFPASPQAVAPNSNLPPYPGYLFETPASLACIYGLVAVTPGCNPNQVTSVATGGSHVVVVVDAYHYATASADLQMFSSQFGLPPANLQIVYASGSQPGTNEGWATEAALDLQMVHSMAPGATIYLVEAASNSDSDLYTAVDVASQIVTSAGGGEVSMSWGGAEYSGETADDAHFAPKAGVVFFASAGDNPGTEYPSTSPRVVAVGGTSISRDPTSGSFLEETVWADGGGGLSAYFALPVYQNGVASSFGNANQRAVPNVAAVANPATGVWIYCGVSCGTSGWLIVGGTSVASPLIAGLTNTAGAFRYNAKAELKAIYANVGTSAFFEVVRGVCGPYAGYFANAGQSYDFCTGIGAPRGTLGF